ncbi:MAG: hypothetical protein Q9221_008827 [Calogaya cf. arnoldii]
MSSNTPKDRSSHYASTNCHVRLAKLSVKKGDGWETLEDAYHDPVQAQTKAKMPEPWNVENVVITGTGIKVTQYGFNAMRANSLQPPSQAEYSWTAHFEQAKWSNFRMLEVSEDLGKDKQGKSIRQGAFIHLIFTYPGRPSGKDSSRFPKPDPKEDDSEDEGEVVEGDSEKEGEILEGDEKGDGVGKDDPVKSPSIEGTQGHGTSRSEDSDEHEAVPEDTEEIPGDETSDSEEGGETVTTKPEAFPLAVLRSESTTDGSALEVRLVFRRSGSEAKVYKWSWPRACAHLAGRHEFILRTKIEETKRQEAMSFTDWAKKIGSTANFSPARFFRFKDDLKDTYGYELRANSAQGIAQSSSSTDGPVPEFVRGKRTIAELEDEKAKIGELVSKRIKDLEQAQRAQRDVAEALKAAKLAEE